MKYLTKIKQCKGCNKERDYRDYCWDCAKDKIKAEENESEGVLNETFGWAIVRKENNEVGILYPKEDVYSENSHISVYAICVNYKEAQKVSEASDVETKVVRVKIHYSNEGI